MQKTATKAKSSSSYTRPTLQKSTTLSRKYVRRPGATRKIDDVKKVKTSDKVAKVVVKEEPKVRVAKVEIKEPKKVLVKESSQAKEADVAFKTVAKAAELSEKIAISAKSAPIKITAVERSSSIQRFNDEKKSDSPKKDIKNDEALKAEIIKEAETARKAAERKEAKEKEIEKKVAEKEAEKKVAQKEVKETKRIEVAKPTKAGAVAAPKARAEVRSKVKARKALRTKDDNEAASDAAREVMRGLASASARPIKKAHRGRRVLLAVGCIGVVVAILGVFVAVNMPNITVTVAAMQTGIDASYPQVVPRGYTMETVAADKDGKITMKFIGPDDTSFVLTEEKSTWDSTAVLNNYVKSNYSANYSTMHEQGITYYSESGSAAWVNGGILYKLTSFGKNLTREQIRNLVVSL